jgi:hypothetical protein
MLLALFVIIAELVLDRSRRRVLFRVGGAAGRDA